MRPNRLCDWTGLGTIQAESLPTWSVESSRRGNLPVAGATGVPSVDCRGATVGSGIQKTPPLACELLLEEWTASVGGGTPPGHRCRPVRLPATASRHDQSCRPFVRHAARKEEGTTGIPAVVVAGRSRRGLRLPPKGACCDCSTKQTPRWKRPCWPCCGSTGSFGSPVCCCCSCSRRLPHGASGS